MARICVGASQLKERPTDRIDQVALAGYDEDADGAEIVSHFAIGGSNWSMASAP
jgi:hypothetical protein